MMPPLPTPPHIDLIVATLGRVEEVDRLLASLCAQNYSQFNVYIADQNPAGYLDAVWARYKDRLRLTIVPLPALGLSAARNALLPLAKGDIIAFPDDDCWYAPETLEKVVDFFAHNPCSCGVVGQWGPKVSKGSPADKSQRQVLTRYSAFDCAGTLVQFYRHQTVEAVGDFDPVLGPGTGLPYGCGEDTDYLLRALIFAQSAGFQMYRDAAIQLYHPLPAVTLSVYREKWQVYGQGRMYLLRKHQFPLWFKLANVLYPLCRIPLETPHNWNYRWHMFIGRCKGLWAQSQCTGNRQ